MPIPFFPYKLFFLYIEPISALAGAYYAALEPARYLYDLSNLGEPASHIDDPELTAPMSMTLYQLANLYLLFALNEHFVLKSTTSLLTWKAVLFGLLVADFGHLASMAWTPMGWDVYWKFWEWNALAWGSVAWVYAGASLRLCFLLNIGLGGIERIEERKVQ